MYSVAVQALYVQEGTESLSGARSVGPVGWDALSERRRVVSFAQTYKAVPTLSLTWACGWFRCRPLASSPLPLMVSFSLSRLQLAAPLRRMEI